MIFDYIVISSVFFEAKINLQEWLSGNGYFVMMDALANMRSTI